MIDTTISHYRILEKLGEGGMGVVYKAEDTKLERIVALKFLPQHIRTNPTAVDRFTREAKAAAALDHPNICTVYEIDEVDGQAFIAMACVEGTTLAEKLDGGVLELADAIGLAIELASGLAAAHESGIVHRDIKPANILLTNRGEVRIADFGLAKLVDQTALTQEGTTVGTVAYMSPEQAQGLEVDARTDIWAVGAVLYQMVTGRRPFGGDREQAVLHSILNRDPEPVGRLRSGVPEALDRVIRKSLAKRLEDRYRSMTDVLEDLHRARTASGSAIETDVRPPLRAERASARRLPRNALGAALAVLALLVGLGTYHLLTREATAPRRISIAVVDFHNETGESELDGLSGMLITALEQSRRLSVLTRSRLFDIVGQLGQTEVDRIDESLGRMICEQAGIDLLAVASVRKFGSAYTLDIKVLERSSSEYLLTADARGDGQESIPGSIDNLAEQIRIGLKERAFEIEASKRNVAAVTTPNLEAYQHFFKGEELLNRLQDSEAIEQFRHAIALDPSFGLATYRLGYALHLNGDNEGARKALDEALRLIDQIPEKEQYLTRAYAAHLDHSKPELEASLAILRQMERLYPEDKEMNFFIGDWSLHVRHYKVSLVYLERVLAMDPIFRRALLHLTLLFRDTGKYDRMLETAQRNASLGEDVETAYLLGSAYTRIGRYEEGVATLERALAMEEVAPIYHEIAFAQTLSGHYERAEAAARAALAIAPTDVWSHYTLNEILLATGQAAQAETLARQAVEDAPGFHSSNLLARALVAGGIDPEEGLALARAAVDKLPPRYEERASSRVFFPLVEETLGQAYGAKGDHEKALLYLKRAAELAPLRPGIQESLRHAREIAAEPH